VNVILTVARFQIEGKRVHSLETGVDIPVLQSIRCADDRVYPESPR